MRKPGKKPRILPIVVDAPRFIRDRKRFNKRHPHLQRDLNDAYKEIRAAYGKIKAGDPIYLHATQSGLGSPLGNNVFKKRVSGDHKGKSGGFRLIWLLKLQEDRGINLALYTKAECDTITAAEIEKALAAVGVKRGREVESASNRNK